MTTNMTQTRKQEYYKKTMAAMGKSCAYNVKLIFEEDDLGKHHTKHHQDTLDTNGLVMDTQIDSTGALKAIEALIKALEAGGYNAAPSDLKQGCSLKVEDLPVVWREFCEYKSK